MKLYIANATTQVQQFSYRVPDEDPRGNGSMVLSKNRTQTVNPGKQIALSGEFSRAQVDAVLDQHRKYGIMEVGEIGRQINYCHIVASPDKPLTTAKLLEVMRKNLIILKEKGKKMREMAAVTAHEEQVKNLMDPDAPTLVKMELEVEEQRDRFSFSDEKPHEEHLRVSSLEPGADEPRSASRQQRAPRSRKTRS